MSENDWFYDVAIGAIRYGWINDYLDGTFRSNEMITRAEVTVIINRMLGRSADTAYLVAHVDELRLFPDVTKNHWAYYPIIEATNSHEYIKADSAETWTAMGK